LDCLSKIRNSTNPKNRPTKQYLAQFQKKYT
jgi:hypothetical protein